MASKKLTRKPTKTIKRKKQTHLTNNQRKDSTEDKLKRVAEIMESQKLADQYNSEYVGQKGFMTGVDLVEHFNSIELKSGMVVHMYMENIVKDAIFNKETKEPVVLNYGIRHIDMRKRNTDKAQWGPTPFPMIDKGVIMAISPELKLWYHERKEKLAKYDPVAAEAMIIPEVGDTVYLNQFLFKEARYYPNKQDKCQDHVRNQEEVSLRKFDFLFKVNMHDIESIVKKGKESVVGDRFIPVDDRIDYVEIDDIENNEEQE